MSGLLTKSFILFSGKYLSYLEDFSLRGIGRCKNFPCNIFQRFDKANCSLVSKICILPPGVDPFAASPRPWSPEYLYIYPGFSKRETFDLSKPRYKAPSWKVWWTSYHNQRSYNRPNLFLSREITTF